MPDLEDMKLLALITQRQSLPGSIFPSHGAERGDDYEIPEYVNQYYDLLNSKEFAYEVKAFNTEDFKEFSDDTFVLL